MKELHSIVAAFRALRDAGEPCALATVVRVCGSAYRRPGARMLVTGSGRTVGSISGGCLETDVVRRARHALLRGGPEVVTYDTTDDDDLDHGVGVGCRGVVDVLVERLPVNGLCYLDVLGEWLDHRRPGVVATVVRTFGDNDPRLGARLLLDEAGRCSGDLLASRLVGPAEDAARRFQRKAPSAPDWQLLSAGAVELVLEPVEAPLPLLLFGAGPDAIPLARLAAELGWDAAVMDPRPGRALRERFPMAAAVMTCQPEVLADRAALDERAAAVVMTHNYHLDRRILPVFLRAPLPYVGMLGPRSRAERLLADLAEDGFHPTSAQRQRLYAPAGLDTGAETPEEIALSILAEIRAVLQARPGGSLRNRMAPIHPREEAAAAHRRPGRRVTLEEEAEDELLCPA